MNLDADEPYCIIKNSSKEIKLSIPKSLAYYLTTHHHGTMRFKELIRKEMGIKPIQEIDKKLIKKSNFEWDIILDDI